MANINIPREVALGLKVIAELGSATRTKITELLRAEAASLDPSAIANTLAARVTELNSEKAQAVINCLISIELARASSSVSVSRLSQDVVTGADIGDENTQKELISWLQETLGIEPLMISAKGISVMQDNERTFLNARIITDVRPVYREGLSEMPSEPPSAAVIVHTLKLSVRMGGKYDEFFVTLDTEDVVKLKNTLDRAQAKTKGLSTFLQSAKINYLEMQAQKDE